MKKNFTKYNDEINIIEVSNVIWKAKIKIFLITIIFFLFGYLNYHYSKNIFKSSLRINPSRDTEFTNFSIIDNLLQGFLKNINKDYSIDLNIVFFEKFYRELIDYEEFLTILKNNNGIKEKISNLSISDQNKILSRYVDNFKVIKEKNNIIVNFTWDKENEAKSILHDTISLTLKQLELSTYKEYEELLKVAQDLSKISLQVKNEFLKNEDSFLQELINFKNQTDNQPRHILDFIRSYTSYVINMELESKKKNYDLNYISTELKSIKEKNIKWIDYNFNLTKLSVIKDNNYDFRITTILGLILGILYAIISNAIKLKKIARKKSN